jgi:cyclase
VDRSYGSRAILTCATRALAAAAFLSFGLAPAAASGSGELESTRLTDKVVQITGAGSNITVLETDDGLVLVNSGAPEHAEALMGFLHEEFDGAPVRVLFNTHWRAPYTGANELIGRSGAQILSHENTRLWMSTEYYVEWEKKNHRPRPPEALPTETFHSSDPQPLALEHGGQLIEYGHLAEAFTDGDIYVYFRDQNVIVVGEVLGVGDYPVPDYSTGGWIGGLQDATRLLIGLTDDRTQVVAAHGPARTRADLETQIEMLDTIHERIRVQMIAAKSIEEILAEDVAQGYESWGDPGQFVHNVYNGLWWGGRLRGAY